jgi:hypothetical protein
MKEPQEITTDKQEEDKPFFTAPFKLPKLKRSSLKSDKGYCPHIVFDQNLGRWILKTDKM